MVHFSPSPNLECPDPRVHVARDVLKKHMMKNEKGFFGVAVAVVLGIIALAVVGSAMNLITIPWLKFNKQVQLNRDLVDRMYDVDNALYNYHWFKERVEAIKATKNKVANATTELANFQVIAGDRSKWTFEDKNEEARLRTIVMGLKSHYEDQAGEYNARAKEADRAVFQDELPTFFSLDAY